MTRYQITASASANVDVDKILITLAEMRRVKDILTGALPLDVATAPFVPIEVLMQKYEPSPVQTPQLSASTAAGTAAVAPTNLFGGAEAAHNAGAAPDGGEYSDDDVSTSSSDSDDDRTGPVVSFLLHVIVVLTCWLQATTLVNRRRACPALFQCPPPPLLLPLLPLLPSTMARRISPLASRTTASRSSCPRRR